jgi:hypothetical protein
MITSKDSKEYYCHTENFIGCSCRVNVEILTADGYIQRCALYFEEIPSEEYYYNPDGDCIYHFLNW